MSFLNSRNPDPGKITYLLNFSTALIFLGLGFMFLATETWVDRYPRPTRIYIGLVLLAWAVFRIITVWLKFKRAKNEDDE